MKLTDNQYFLNTEKKLNISLDDIFNFVVYVKEEELFLVSVRALLKISLPSRMCGIASA